MLGIMREGMIRCLKAKTLSKITVSDLCNEAGVNRATFYNHYESPAMILRELAYEYAGHLADIYENNQEKAGKGDETALEKCLTYISERRAEIKILFSEHAEHYLSGVCLEIINEKAVQKASSMSALDRKDEYLLLAAAVASAIYGFVQIWLTKDIGKTPRELVDILKRLAKGEPLL